MGSVECTGYAAVFVLNQDGSKEWKLGIYGNITGLSTAADLSNFPSTLTNMAKNGPIELQVPPNTVDGYTLLGTNVWAYNTVYRVWYEVTQASWQMIQSQHTSGTINYTVAQAQVANFYLVNRSMPMDPSISQPTGNIEIAYTRTGKTPVPHRPEQVVCQSGVPFKNDVHPVFGQRNPADALLVWSYTNNNWLAVYKREIVLEMINSNAGVAYRPSIAMSILMKSYTLGDPIIYTGRAAVLCAMLDGTFTWKKGLITQNSYTTQVLPSNFAAILSNYDPHGPIEAQQPPSQIGDYEIDANYFWAYHITCKMWFEVDDCSWQRIQIAGVIDNIDYNSDKVIPGFLSNNTQINDPSTSYHGDIEVIMTRVATPPNLNTLTYFGTTINFATYTDPVYGSSVPGLAVKRISDGSWQAIFLNTIILAPFKNIAGNIQWRPTVISVFNIQGSTVDINNQISKYQSNEIPQMITTLSSSKANQQVALKYLPIIETVLSGQDLANIHTAINTIQSGISSIEQLIMDSKNAITNTQTTVTQITNDPNNIAQIGLQLISYITTNAAQVTNNSNQISSSCNSIVSAYTAICNGNIISVEDFQKEMLENLLTIQGVIDSLAKAESMVSAPIYNSNLIVSQMSAALDPSLPVQAQAYVKTATNDLAAITGNKQSLIKDLANLQNLYNSTPADLKQLITLDIQIIEMINKANSYEVFAGLKSADIEVQCQNVLTIQAKLNNLGNTTYGGGQAVLINISNMIDGLKTTLSTWKTSSTSMIALVNLITELSTNVDYTNLQILSNIITQRINTLSGYVSDLTNQYNSLLSQYGSITGTSNFAQLATLTSAINTLSSTASNNVGTVTQLDADIKNKAAPIYAAIVQDMYQWCQHSPAIIDSIVSQMSVIQTQATGYNNIAQSTLLSASSVQVSVIQTAAGAVATDLANIKSFIPHFATYKSQIQTINTGITSSSTLPDIQNAYSQIQVLINIASSNLTAAQGYVRDAAVQAAFTQNPQPNNVFEVAINWVRSILHI